MGRPQKQGADYFPHDSNFRNDERMLAVRRKFGLEGYAVFVMLMEKATQNIDIISDAENIVSDAETTLKLELLAGEFYVEAERLGQMIRYFVQLGLLKKQGKDRLCVPYLTEKMQPLLAKRKRNAGNYKKRSISDSETAITAEYQKPKSSIQDISDSETQVSEAESTQSKVKETKVSNKEKINKKKLYGLFASFWDAYPNKKSKGTAEKSFEKVVLREGTAVVETMLAAIAAQCENRKNLEQHGQFVPLWKHPATWLNGRCWEDEIENLNTSNRYTANETHSKKPSIGTVSRTSDAFADLEV